VDEDRMSGNLALGPRQGLSRYLLVCHAKSLSLTEGIWCFNLETLAGESLVEAEDTEEGDLNRLSLLAAVRGLEAVDGRSIVSLISNNRYLIRSLDSALPRWRENDFVWDHYGRKIAVQNADLWRRIDRTLAIHEVTASLVQTTRVSSLGAGGPSFAGEARGVWGDEPARGPASEAHGWMSPSRDDDDFRFDPAHHLRDTGMRSGAAAGGNHPSDRLRRWLAGDEANVLARPPRRGRYRAEDLALG
jgi:ribonuclease HI